MVFKLLLKDGQTVGKYSDKKSPALIAKAMMKVIYQKTGAKTKEIKFTNDKNGNMYTYNARIIELEKPETIYINKKKFMRRYKIFVERI